MKAAVLDELGAPPRFGDFPEPPAGGDHVVVDVTAAGVNHVDLLKASGKFYTGPPSVPSVVGSDGVGRTPDGRRVFFDSCMAPFGSWAEKTLVRQADLVEPAEGLDDVTAAALGNTGLAAWLGLSWQARLQPGESVLVLGASGALGSVAVQAAKVLGAGLVVAADRDPGRKEALHEQGADAVVVLDADTDAAAAFRTAAPGGFDVIVDPLWGAPALAAIQAAALGARLVQLGQLAGVSLEVPAPAMRAVGLDLRAFAVFHAPLEIRRQGYKDLTEHAARGAISPKVEQIALAEVAAAWERQRTGPGAKLVLTP